MKFLRAPIAIALSVLCLSACTPHHSADTARVSLMTYNVENLFDTVHDEGKDDYAYLPLSVKQAHPEYLATCTKIDVAAWRKECEENDWTDALLNEKLKRLSAVIQQINQGRGPDILMLDEVENINVIEQLNSHLGKSDYKTRVLIEGWDARGIDTAVLSRLPQWDKARLHRVPYKALGNEDQERVSKTRGILEVRLLLPGGQKAAVFAVHLPSGGAPGYLRQQAVAYLAHLKSELPSDVLPIVGGDFNINAGEEKQNGYIAKDLASTWAVSQFIGCNDCKGSYYYHTKREWSFFDMLLFPKQMTTAGGFNGWQVDPASIRLANHSPYQVNRWGSPARFDSARHAEGVSDHWPLYAEIFRPAP
ncbi:endonuclease/exonuclease/phosphatase family protein [Pseudomonas helleri]|uniref:endonuclease/exonuclease/phosphatase family protein n=1 Tax=Pseudomonas helleri TaxID=1608996 RepID=UPI003D0E057F